jgi:PhnB protein
MATINPYLNFMGKTEEAFNFYKAAFGGEFKSLNRFTEAPHSDQIPAEDREKIMYIALPIGNGNLLMGTDMLESMGHSMTAGNNFSVSITPDSKEEADKLYKALSAGGKIEMPLEDAFWGAYFGMFADKYGIQWIINYEYPKK